MTGEFIHRGVTAHRGNSKEFVENTLPAFESAFQAGVDWIELDVHLTRDGVLAVIHDENTYRVSTSDLKIADFDWRRVSQVVLDLGGSAEARIPRLEEVLELAKSYATRVSIEPKADCLVQLISLVKQTNAVEQVAFNHWNRKRLMQARAQLTGLHLFWDRPAGVCMNSDIPKACAADVQGIVLNRAAMNANTAELIRDSGFECGSWTVNDPGEWKRFLDMGVQRFYTDDPLGLVAFQQQT